MQPILGIFFMVFLLGFWSEVIFMNVEFTQVKFACDGGGEKVQRSAFRLIVPH